ncbi:type II secretion system protein N [Kangiella koreensis]|uniref:Type II secretion system protein N n=1 Tax=Kangiella koreensis (strain DSM 16069 / JCM 12317 / KCTC 12182 / SW-125) TaxID=523791 RepID=C7R8F0_KANKD|nr:type II secretion system protein N [Kangiella koreensis]ACV27715.1 type II secretion system protein N [Kangiella koreensis DSM 16069]
MKKWVLGSIIGVTVLLIFLVVMAPARIVLPWATNDLKQLTLNQPSGTIWEASLESITYQGRSIEDISIKTSFFNLLIGNLSSHITVNDNGVSLEGDVILNSQNMVVNSARYQIEASSILDWVQLPITELSGRFIGDINGIELATKELKTLDANGYWQNAVVGYPNSVLELGDIHFTVERTDNGRALLTITDNPGILDLKGTLEVGFDKQYQLDVSTQTDVPSNIKQWLTQLGRTEDNRILIKWNGRLP